MLDFDSNLMSFSINGVPMGCAFSEIDHGNRPTDEGVIKDRYGPNWESGFYPAITVGIDQSVVLNLGQNPFQYMPVGFSPVCAPNNSYELPDGRLDAHLLYDLKVWKNNPPRKWTHVSYGLNSVLPLDDVSGFFCALQPSMRVSLNIPIRDSQGLLKSQRICSAKSLSPKTWTHCSVVVDAVRNEVEFYVDQVLDSATRIQSGKIECNTGPLGLAVSPSTFRVSDYENSHVWVSDIQCANRALTSSEIMEQVIPPFHLRVVSCITPNFQNAAAAESLSRICTDPDDPVQQKTLDLILTLGRVDENILEQMLQPKGVLAIATRLLEHIEHRYVDLNDPVFVSSLELLYTLSATDIGRAVLIKLDVMIRLISILPAETMRDIVGPAFFWAESCIANLQISVQSPSIERWLDDLVHEKVDFPTANEEDWLFFQTAVQPYSPDPNFPSVWEKMPLAIWVSELRSIIVVAHLSS
jgi:hypothetical protein